MHSLPILEAHRADPEHVIGHVTPAEGGLKVEFLEAKAPARDQFFEIFGNCGFSVLKQIQRPDEHEPRIVQALIHEFSL
jgi:hypothetical protein